MPGIVRHVPPVLFQLVTFWNMTSPFSTQMSTFCVTGDKKNVDAAVEMLKLLIAEGNSDVLAAGGNNGINHMAVGNGNSNNNNNNGSINSYHERRGSGSMGMRGPPVGGEVGHRLVTMGSDLSRSEGSPATAPCRFVLLGGIRL